MPRLRRAHWAAMFCFAIVTAGACSDALAAKPQPPPPPSPNFRFELQLLGTLGGTWSTAMDINQLGDVAGFSPISSGRQHGFVHFAGDSQMTDVNSLIDPSLHDPTWQNGWEITAIGALNENGQMVGSARLYENGVRVRSSLVWLSPDPDTGFWGFQELAPSGTIISDVPIDMNAQGDVVFLGENYESYIWTPEDGLVNLGRWNGLLTYVTALSDRDAENRIQVAGTIFTGPPYGAWGSTYTVGTAVAGTIYNLGYLYSDRNTPGESQVVGMNSSGTVLFGETTVAKDDIFAAVYANGAWTSLGTLNPTAKNGSWNNSWSSAGNDLGYVIGGSMVGTSSSTPNKRTFIYHHTFKMWNLDSLIDAWVPIEMGLDFCGINNANEIGGTLGNGIDQAFVLIPYTP